MRGRGSCSGSWVARSAVSALSYSCSGRCRRSSSSSGSTRSIHRASCPATGVTLYLGCFGARRGQRRPRVPLDGGQKALRVECGHAARARGGDRLAVRAVLDVARSEHTRDVRLGGARLRDQVPAGIVVELVAEELRVRVVADRDEEPVGVDLPRLIRDRVAQAQPLHLGVAEDLHHFRVQHEIELVVHLRAVDHDPRGAELVPAVHEVDVRRELRQEESLLECRVAAADDVDVAVTEERRVAGRAGRDAAALVLLLRLDPEPAGACAGRHDHGARPVLVVADPDPERLLREIDPGHVVGQVLGAEALRLAPKVRHHLRPHDAVGVPGIVLDVARDHQLATPVEALDHERLQVGARRVERSRIPGGASADDDQLTDVLVAQKCSSHGKSVCSSKRDRAAGCSAGIERKGTGKDGSMTTTVTDSVLRTLSGFRAENGCAISLYIDLDPSSTPTAPDVVTKFNALLSELEKEAEARSADRDCGLALRDDLARIRSWLDGEFDRDGTKGVAIFASAADGEFRALALPERVGDLTRIGSEFAVALLAGQLGRDGALVAVLSRERGNVYRFSGGRLVEIVDESEETQGQHSQGGWAQARYQRHIEHLVQQHLKTVGQEIDRRTRGAGGLQLVIVAPEELRSEIEGTLSAEAREALIGWRPAEAQGGPSELLEVVRALLDEAGTRVEEEELERWQEEHGRGGRAAAG